MISRFVKRISAKAGMAPGTLVHVGEKKTDQVIVDVLDFDGDYIHEARLQTIDQAAPYRDSSTTSWIRVVGLHQVDLIERLGTLFNIHTLTLEDIVQTGQRPKMDDYDDYIYLTLRLLAYDEKIDEIQSEQISLILGPHFVLSLHESENPLFETFKERIRKGKGRIRKSGCDYLLYAIMDIIIDEYFVVLEKIGQDIEDLEEDLLENPTTDILRGIHAMKREMILFRKQIWPLREILSRLRKVEYDLIDSAIDPFFNDLYDHTIHIMDTIESFRDILSGLLDLYLSFNSNKMNEVMKLLTIIATIFIPITFVVGVYGMNFQYMPELAWRYGYALSWVIILLISGGMLWYFRRNDWI